MMSSGRARANQKFDEKFKKLSSPPKKPQQSWHAMDCKINLPWSVLYAMGERKKAQKEEKPF